MNTVKRSPSRAGGPLKVAVVSLAAAAVLASGCAKKATAGTSGSKLNACAGVASYNRLQTPVPDDHAAVVRYAEDFAAIVKNVSFKEKYKDANGKMHDVPLGVRNDFGVVRASMDRYRDAVKAADKEAPRAGPAATAASFKAAESTLAADRNYTEADKRLQRFFADGCRR
ncbi:MAG TPA: hypothetical protein VFA94_11830 [Acidimicrobiales bacterium]|nr:hypothetical protein [Acidimicrobiales bacterium]